MVDIEYIQNKVLELGKVIAAPASLLVVSDKQISDGVPYIQFLNNQYRFVVSERGVKVSDFVTSSLDELLYFIFSRIASSIGYSYESENRIYDQDYRRISFSRRIELLEMLNKEWAKRESACISTILEEAPYDDDVFKRVELSKLLMTKGLSADQAYSKACEKYPFP